MSGRSLYEATVRKRCRGGEGRQGKSITCLFLGFKYKNFYNRIEGKTNRKHEAVTKSFLLRLFDKRIS